MTALATKEQLAYLRALKAQGKVGLIPATLTQSEASQLIEWSRRAPGYRECGRRRRPKPSRPDDFYDN